MAFYFYGGSAVSWKETTVERVSATTLHVRSQGQLWELGRGDNVARVVGRRGNHLWPVAVPNSIKQAIEKFIAEEKSPDSPMEGLT